MNRTHLAGLAGLLFLVAFVTGCPGGLTIELPNGDTRIIPGIRVGGVVVEIFNDTDFEVDPRIRFNDEDPNFFEQLLGSDEELTTGILRPGESIEFTYDCDNLLRIYSDTAGQFFFESTIGQADRTRTLERGEEFHCGDDIVFHFLGDYDGFGVVVSVNGAVVD